MTANHSNQAGEYTCPSESAVSSAMSVNDVSVDSHEAPSHVMICVKCSKTDPFDTGFILHVGHTRDELLSYLAQRPLDPGFLFLFHDGTPPSQDRLCRELRLALHAAGVDASEYSGPE